MTTQALHAIDYQGGQIFVDKEAKFTDTDTAYNTQVGTVGKVLRVLNMGKGINDVTTLDLNIQLESTSSENNFLKVVAQSLNLSLEGIPYVEIEEDVESKAKAIIIAMGYKWEDTESSARAVARFVAASAKKYTEEDVRKLYLGTLQNVGTSVKQCDMPTWEQVLQSLQPKVVSIEVEMEDFDPYDPRSKTGRHETEDDVRSVTYTKELRGKMETFLKVIKFNYESIS